MDIDRIPLYVLNLVINGLPSILKARIKQMIGLDTKRFKPCYKWITFNTLIQTLML